MFTTLHSFDGTNGANPVALVQDPNGDLYGTAYSGGIGINSAQTSGQTGSGTVFRLGADGVFTNLIWFDGTNGGSPALLIQTRDGALYGVTHLGTVFQMDRDGTLVNPKVAFFSETFTIPVWILVTEDGTIFGTTEFSGRFGRGTVFRRSVDGTFTNLVDFDGTNGALPCTLVQSEDGTFYGSTQSGGTGYNGGYGGYGIVFRLTTNGTLNSLFSFSGTNGSGLGLMTEIRDGHFYGTTRLGGLYGAGTVFKMTTNGTMVWSFSFDGTNGAGPNWLTPGCDGMLYGTTESGGLGYNGTRFSGPGTVFRLTPEGEFTSLFSFEGTNGAMPGMLVQGIDGTFFGTSYEGGPYGSNGGYGTVFRLSIPLPPVFRSAIPTNNSVRLTWSSVAGQQYQLQYRPNLSAGDWADLGSLSLATNGTMTALDTLDSGSVSQRFYRVILAP